LRLLLPRTPEMSRNREQFANRSEPAFDAMGAAATAADLSLRLLLDPARAARLVDFHRRNGTMPDFSEVLSMAIDHVFADTAPLAPREAELARVVQRVLVERMLDLSANTEAPSWVRTRVDLALSDLLQRIDQITPLDTSERSHFDSLGAEIGRHLARPSPPREPSRTAQPEPPGEPIGSGGETLGDCDFGEGH